MESVRQLGEYLLNRRTGLISVAARRVATDDVPYQGHHIVVIACFSVEVYQCFGGK